MKRMIALIILSVISFSSLMAEDAYDTMRDLVKSKDFVNAEKYIKDAIALNPKNQDAFVMAGDIYTELEKFNQALDMYKAADDIEDYVPDVVSKLGVAYAITGNKSEAINILKKGIKKNPENVYMVLALGKAYLIIDSIDQATLQITKARELNKRIAEPYVALGDLYFAQKVYELAKYNYEEALKIDENLTEARIKLATAYYWMGNIEYDQELSNELFNRSLKEWNIISQKEPKYARAWWEQGRILFFAKRWDLSAGTLLKYLELRPDHSLARWYLAQSYVELGRCDSAAGHLRQVAVEIDSVKGLAGLKLAQCLFEQKDFGNSLAEYEKIRSFVNLELTDIERMAAAALKAADTTKTIELYKEVIAKDPTKCNTMFQLANLTIYMKDYKNAIYFLDKRNENCKDSLQSKVYYLLGTCWFNSNRADTASVILTKAIELDPKNLQAKIYLADVKANLGKKDEAKADFMSSLAVALSDTAIYKREINQAYSKLSNLLLDQKNFKEMNTYAKQWTEYDPNSEFAWLYLGISWQGMADKDNACKAYKKGLTVNPKNNFLNSQIKKLECN
jgi:tetratricopeptide (TPR) repeat protein